MWLRMLSFVSPHEVSDAAASRFEAANTIAHCSSVIGKTPMSSLHRASILRAR
jgi:hypothetical protein